MKHNTFDKLLLVAMIPVAFVSANWTNNFLSGLIQGSFERWIVTILLTAAEIYGVREFVRTGNAIWGTIALLVALTSVTGSFGNFQTMFERNIMQSDQYQAKKSELALAEQQVGKWQSAADNPAMSGWASKKADDARQDVSRISGELNQMMDMGAGTGNAVFRSYASVLNWSVNDTSFRFNLFLGCLIEFILIFRTAQQAKIGEQKPTSAPSTNGKAKKDWKKKLKESFEGDKDYQPKLNPLYNVEQEQIEPSPLGKANRKKKLNKQNRLNILREYLQENPSATYDQIMDATGIKSRTTVKKYRDQLGV